MRIFAFENENGTRFSLMTRKAFLNLPDGLGFDHEISYQQVGNYYMQNSKKILQKQITGEIVFLDDWEDGYKDLLEFVTLASDLKLVYQTNAEYLIDIDFKTLTKGDTRATRRLTSMFTFIAKSQFYKKRLKVHELSADSNENRWDIRWDVQIIDSASGLIEFTNEGQLPAPFVLKIDGACVDPEIEIINNGESQEVVFDIELAAGDSIEMSTVDNDLYITKTISGATTNAIDILDITKENFIKIPKGFNQIYIRDSVPSATLTVFESYIGV
jgi:hypothetical protein